MRRATSMGDAVAGAMDVTLSLVWFALFFVWIALVPWTVVHCVTRFRPPVWAMILFVILVFVPYLGVAIYWGVYAVSRGVRGVDVAKGQAAVGWYADPFGRFELRFWDGARWTEHVSRQGRTAVDSPSWTDVQSQ